MDAAEETFGTRDNVENFRSLAGEDFAQFSHKVPSVMTWVGIADKKKKSEEAGKPDLNILFIYNMPFRAIAKMTGCRRR